MAKLPKLKPRNTSVLAARSRIAGMVPMKDRRTSRAGNKNKQTEFLKEADDEADENELAEKIMCSVCSELCLVKTAHLHQGEYIGDECCWDERLKSSE